MKAILISLKPNKKTNQTEIRLKSSLSKESTIYKQLMKANEMQMKKQTIYFVLS